MQKTNKVKNPTNFIFLLKFMFILLVIKSVI